MKDGNHMRWRGAPIRRCESTIFTMLAESFDQVIHSPQVEKANGLPCSDL